MNRKIEMWTVQKILNLLYKNKLNYKPNIQRQFVYKKEQQQQVIVSIKKGFVASSLVVEMTSPGEYTLLDGKQRINSIIGFINRAFDVQSCYFSDKYRLDTLDVNDRYLSPRVIEEPLASDDCSDSAILLKFEFPVVIYSDMTDEERLTLFNVINTTGEKLNAWELISGRYPNGLLLDMRANYFNENTQTNTVSLNTNYIRVKKFEKYFETHEVNRGELYIKIIEKMYVMLGGKLDDEPYEIIDGVVIHTKNYNRLCRFIEKNKDRKFEDFAKPLIDKLDVFYDMFKDVNNLRVLKESCFNISDEEIFVKNKDIFMTDSKRAILSYLITQYNNSDLKNGNDHSKFFREQILPMTLLLEDDFKTELDNKRFYNQEDKERIFFASKSLDHTTNQVKCEGVMNDGVTPCGCGRWISKDEATVDHIKPWILGGKTNDENAQILCRECNSRKGSKIISDILSQKGMSEN